MLIAVGGLLVAIGGGVVAGVWLIGGTRHEVGSSCQESVHTAEAKVRTYRSDPPNELPALGNYPEIHWQVRAMGNACSPAPGPTDLAYQGVVKLNPGDALTLAKQFEFVPFDPSELPSPSTPADVWPKLRPYLPSGARWLHSQSYNETNPSSRWRVAFLDVDHRTLLFMLNDH